jgi:hypothetical protein
LANDGAGRLVIPLRALILINAACALVGHGFAVSNGGMKDASRCNDGQRRGACGFRRVRGGAVLGRQTDQLVRHQVGCVGPEAPELLIKTTAAWRQPVIRKARLPRCGSCARQGCLNPILNPILGPIAKPDG